MKTYGASARDVITKQPWDLYSPRNGGKGDYQCRLEAYLDRMEDDETMILQTLMYCRTAGRSALYSAD